MKKVTLILSALALVLGLSQCKKQEEPVQSGEKQHIVLNASFAESNSKIVEDGFGGLKWSDEDGNEDHIIVKQGETELGELKCTDAEDGIFEGDIESATGNITFTFGEEKYLEQTGNLNAAIYLTASAPYDAKGEYNVTMNMPHAVLKLNVSALGTTGAMTIAANGATVASVTDVSGIANAVFVAVPADGSTTAYTITCGGKTATKTWTLEKNVFYTKAGAEGAGTGNAIEIEPDAPATPKFTVDADGTTVEFAPGNLYWDGSAFRFEADQWSFANTWNASHVSHFYWSKDADEAKKEVFDDEEPMLTDVFFTNDSDFQVSGEAEGTWRTLSRAEWNYLLNTRTNASSLRAWKTLDDGVTFPSSGLVILPDGTENPEVVLENMNSTDELADYGAVFLPLAGYRSGNEVEYFEYGYYWSSTLVEGWEYSAYIMQLYSGEVSTESNSREFGNAVRLVRNITE